MTDAKSNGDGTVTMPCGDRIALGGLEFHIQRCPSCGGVKEPGGRRHKYGAEKTVDPETGRQVDSKLEAKGLAKLRQQARADGFIVAVQPMFPVEGGTYRADAVIIRPLPAGTGKDGQTLAEIKVLDWKGLDTASSRKSRRQVKARYGIDVETRSKA